MSNAAAALFWTLCPHDITCPLQVKSLHEVSHLQIASDKGAPMSKKLSTIKRMDHVGVVVDDLEAALAFFLELGMESVGGVTPVEGRWVDQVVGLDNVQVDIAFVRTPDGHSQLELTQFRHPQATTSEANAPANRLGLRRLMFLVEDIQDTITRLRPHGGELIGEVAEFQNIYRLCYLRGPGGIIVALAEEMRGARRAGGGHD
jgi:catechol 2,3-dioxygenase-like lactoylglutathione lyase family enzyme